MSGVVELEIEDAAGRRQPAAPAARSATVDEEEGEEGEDDSKWNARVVALLTAHSSHDSEAEEEEDDEEEDDDDDATGGVGESGEFGDDFGDGGELEVIEEGDEDADAADGRDAAEDEAGDEDAAAARDAAAVVESIALDELLGGDDAALSGTGSEGASAPDDTASGSGAERPSTPVGKFGASLKKGLGKVKNLVASKRTSVSLATSPPTSEPKFKPSQTRSHILPPKDPKEDARHLRQRKAMERNFRKREKREAKEAAIREKQQAKREAHLEMSTKVWLEDVLPNWEKRHRQKSVRSLWRKGLPPRIRTQVWPLAVGNGLQVTEQLFCIVQEKALVLRTRSSDRLAEVGERAAGAGLARQTRTQINHDAESLQISLDLPRTFPSLGFFKADGPLYEQLRIVLEAYVSYRPDIGYVQGMSYIAAVLLLYLDTYATFQVFCNMVNCNFLLDFLRADMERVGYHLSVFNYLFHDTMPALYRHFQDIGISPEMFIIDWYVTLFAKSIPLDCCSRIWDNYMLDGEVFIHRAALGLLKMWEGKLRESNFEQCMGVFGQEVISVEAGELFKAIDQVPVTTKRYAEVKTQLDA